MDDSLKKFLIERGVATESIKCMEDDKIDATVIGILSDESLQKYIPKYGDRIAVKAYVNSKSSDANPEEIPRKSLLERLRNKVKKNKEHVCRSTCQQGNKHAQKTSRRVEVGWLDFDIESKTYKQVKSPSGGGTRHEIFDVNCTLKEILGTVLHWFFPNGKSRRGKVEDFNYFLTDATHQELDDQLDVQSLYTTRKCKLLRLYLASKRKEYCETVESADSDDSLPNVFAEREMKDDNDVILLDSISMSSFDSEILFGPSLNPSEADLNSTLPYQRQDTESDKQSKCEEQRIQEQMNSTPTSDNMESTSIGQTTGNQMDRTLRANDLPPPSDGQRMEEQRNTTSTLDNMQSTSSGQTTGNHMDRTSTATHTLPVDDGQTTQGNSVIVTIHRTKVLQEFISIFIDPHIVHTEMKVRFVDEAGADANGLSREAYSAFWKEFFLTAACGEFERVPAIFPDFGKDEWQAVGRILLKGFTDCGVFPLQLSYAFAEALIYGEDQVSPDDLVDSLKNYLSETEKKVIEKAQAGDEMDEDDNDEFLDLLARVDCHRIPTEVRQVIISIAHKELIQKPKYALDEMAQTARKELQSLLPTPKALKDMYAAKKPTARKVVKMLVSNPKDREESTSLSYLKQFIKGLDDPMLQKFLRFVTGSEMICTESIEVVFVKTWGLGRAPVAHTCGPMLELPSTYSCYRDLRSEFINILDANYLAIQIM